MKHYYVSPVVMTQGARRGFNVVEEVSQETMTTVWGNIYYYAESRRDALRIAEALNLLEEKENALRSN